MGVSKDNMQPSTPQSKGIFSTWKERRKNKGAHPPKSHTPSDEEVANTFADNIGYAKTRLEKLIESKAKDLANEKGQETANKKKLNLLNAMDIHLEIIADLMDDY